MFWLRTVGWLACVVYSTIPSFWLMIHPRAHHWREVRSPYRVLVPAWIVMWVGVGALTGPWRQVAIYTTAWSWIPAGLLFCTGFWIYARAGMHFSWAQLGGLPELQAEHREQRLVTTGIRARVRHPVYLGHLCEMLAWSVGTGLIVCSLLTAFAMITGTVMIRMEDAELEKRFGEEYRQYRRRVPAALPRVRRAEVRSKLSVADDRIQYVLDTPQWELSLVDVACLAEYTTAAGPYVDDYYLVFMTKGGLFYEASFYCDGRDAALHALGVYWRVDLRPLLMNLTHFASRVVWPQNLEGKPLFLGENRASVNPEVMQLASHVQPL